LKIPVRSYDELPLLKEEKSPVVEFYCSIE